MLTHLVILLDNTSVSYCYYDNVQERRLISLGDLRDGIIWAMKMNLNVQYVYPDYKLPKDYTDVIDIIDHTKIKPQCQHDDADVIVLTEWKKEVSKVANGSVCIIRASRDELKTYFQKILTLSKIAERLIITLTDVEKFSDNEINSYKALLSDYVDFLYGLYRSGKTPQISILTDRIMLSEMNNCNAGVNNITLAPNGHFYLCPSFYYDDPRNDCGDLKRGLLIKNQNLLKIDHAPICRNCDAYHCRRCVWMNNRLTLDCNTPSHQQCVVAHLERNASRLLQLKLQENGIQLTPSHEIKEIDYLDPFIIVNKWN